MSAEIMAAASPVADKKAHKHKKDKSEKKSKKRAREEEQAQQSPTKKPRPAKDTDATPQKQSKSKTSMFQKPAAAPATAAAGSIDSDDSPFALQTISLYLPLASIGQQYPLKALCAEHLSPLLLTYYPPLKGVVLAYNNARLSEGPGGVSSDGAVLARSVNEFAVSFIWVTADFVVLRPRKGIWVEGCANLQNESHLGLVCWNLFSASIDRKRLPEDWTWVAAGEGDADDDEDADAEDAGKPDAGQGHFVDAQGKKVDGVIKFRIRDFETSPRTENDRGFITIEGSLLPADKEKELDEQELEKYAARNAARKGRSRPRGGVNSGARR